MSTDFNNTKYNKKIDENKVNEIVVPEISKVLIEDFERLVENIKSKQKIHFIRNYKI